MPQYNFPQVGGNTPRPNKYTTGSVVTPTINTLTTIVDISGKGGKLNYISIYNLSNLNTTKSMDIKITIDGVVVFYSGITNVSGSNYQQAISIGNRLVGGSVSYIPAITTTDPKAFNYTNANQKILSNAIDGTRVSTISTTNSLCKFCEPYEFKSSLKVEFLITDTNVQSGIYIDYETE